MPPSSRPALYTLRYSRMHLCSGRARHHPTGNFKQELEVAPFKGRARPMPSLRLVFSRACAAFSLACRFFCASDFRLLRRRNRFIDWFNALLCVVLYTVDCPAHGVRLHEICVVGAQHGSQFVEIGSGVEPSIIVFRQQHHRHAIMNSSNQGVGFTHDDGGRQNLLATEPVELPNSRKGKRLKILSTESIRLLPIISLLPLIETRGWNKAAALCERLTEQRKLVHGLNPRVNVWNLRFLFHPEWDETPAGHDKLPISVSGIDAHDRNLVRRADIVPRAKVQTRNSTRTKQYAIRI